MAAPTGEKLAEYRRKRDFRQTLEPAGADKAVDRGCLYVMHHHAARRDHFDLRLQQGDVLRSWALPKGASLTPGEKRLAIEVEDHPLEYGGFEGIIPEGQYGGGTVMLWDAGSWSIDGKQDADHLDIQLVGQKLAGRWTLVRTKWESDSGKHNWLMIKRTDDPPHDLHPDDRSVASGRTMEEIAADKNWIWHSNRAGDPPPMIAPQLATLADEAPTGEGWLHEIKFDGYRIMARLNHGDVLLYTRNGKDWTDRFPEIARFLSTLAVTNAIFDGEVAALQGDGSSSFRKLQECLSSGNTGSLRYYVFDLPYVNGRDLTDTPLAERKQTLLELLRSTGVGKGDLVSYSEHVEGHGQAFYEQACRLRLEGVISKRADAPYRSRREKTWLKTKCTHQQEFVIGGFTPPHAGRTSFRSLLLGAFDGSQFRYAGRVGTGFSEQQRDDLRRQLDTLVVKERPFIDEVPGISAGVTWVEPRMVIDVEFTERTRDGRLRHPVFRGFREDREPSEIKMEKPKPSTVAGVRISHPDRILYRDQGITKIEMASYYEGVADWMLPLVARRPLSLVRCPEGTDSACFFQKHPLPALTKGLPRIAIAEKDGETNDYVHVESAAHLVTLVQAGTLELHPWGCRVDDIEHPDILVFDLDPGPDVDWNDVISATRDLRDRLADLGLTGFLRTSGGKGLHVVVPLKPSAGWDEAKAFAKSVAERQASDDPRRLTSNMAKAKRQGRTFIDYLRNGRGQTAIASYSTRARPGATVAVPIRWDELTPDLRPDQYNILNLQRRLRALERDPWDGFDQARVPLEYHG